MPSPDPLQSNCGSGDGCLADEATQPAGPPRPRGLRRSLQLYRAFRAEQQDPDGCYRLIARDAVSLVRRHLSLPGILVADFGGGPGYYSEAFRSAGARTVLVDSSLAEIRLHGRRAPGAVVARAEQPPLRPGSVDLAFSSNLLEHVADFKETADAVVRVVRPGGIAVLSYTVWLSPGGGHETAPWHYLGGSRAARRYAARHGRPPKNLFGETMFAAGVKDGMSWLASRPDLELLEMRPRYLPRRLRGLVRVPVLREFVTWNLWIVVRVPHTPDRSRDSARNSTPATTDEGPTGW